MNEIEHKIKDDKITEMLLQHFKDDNERFEKLTQLAVQNGEHLSYFNKHIVEVKKTQDKIETILIKNAEETKAYRETVNKHMDRVEPVIKAYEDSLVIKANDEKRASNVGKLAVLVSSIGILGSAIIWLIKTITPKI